MTHPDVPKPPPHTDRATRVTALAIIGRVHTGRGTPPDQLAREADVLIPWLASGKLPEPGAVMAEAKARFEQGVKDDAQATRLGWKR